MTIFSGSCHKCFCCFLCLFVFLFTAVVSNTFLVLVDVVCILWVSQGVFLPLCSSEWDTGTCTGSPFDNTPAFHKTLGRAGDWTHQHPQVCLETLWNY